MTRKDLLIDTQQKLENRISNLDEFQKNKQSVSETKEDIEVPKNLQQFIGKKTIAYNKVSPKYIKDQFSKLRTELNQAIKKPTNKNLEGVSQSISNIQNQMSGKEVFSSGILFHEDSLFKYVLGNVAEEIQSAKDTLNQDKSKQHLENSKNKNTKASEDQLNDSPLTKNENFSLPNIKTQPSGRVKVQKERANTRDIKWSDAVSKQQPNDLKDTSLKR